MHEHIFPVVINVYSLKCDFFSSMSVRKFFYIAAESSFLTTIIFIKLK